MGILDFFRRSTAVPTVGASNVDRSSETISTALGKPNPGESTNGSSSVFPLVEQPNVGLSEADELSSRALPIPPPAWSVLAPIATVAQRSMHSSFDTGIEAKLRTLRGPSDLFVSSALSHTVNRKASGVVDGLLTPSAAPPGFAAWQSDSHQVLRRQHPTAAELPALDVAHSRWPILSRIAGESASVAPASNAPRSTSFSASVPAMPQARSERDEFTPGDAPDDVIHRSEAEEAGPTSPSSVVTSGLAASKEPTDASAEPFRSTIGRSLPLVSAEAGLSRTTLPKPDATTAAFAAPVISRKLASPNGDQSEPSAVLTPLSSLTSSRSTLSSPSTVMSGMTDPIVDPGSASKSTVEPASLQRSVGEFTSLRRRSIIEMPSTSPSVAGIDYSATDVPSSVEPFDLSVGSPTSPATIARTSEALSSGEVAPSASEPSASRPTLGRKAGLGEPMSEVPASALVALRGESSSDPFAGWNDETPDLALARTSDTDSAELGSSSTFVDSGLTLSRSADESESTSVSAPVLTTPLADSYLRVVTGTEPGERSEPEAVSPVSLPTMADRPLLGDQSILYRSTDGLSTEGLLASSTVLQENARTPVAVPVQRMSTPRNVTSVIGAAALQRKNSSVEMVRTQSNESAGSDSFSNVPPRQLQRVPDSDTAPIFPNGRPDQPQGFSSVSAPVISRSDIAPIHRVPLARLSATDASSFFSPLPQQSGLANSTPGKQQSVFRRGEDSSVAGASAEPSVGRLALLDRSVDRNGPSLSSSWGIDSGLMQRESESTYPNTQWKDMESGSKYPNQNESWQTSTTENETHKSSTPEKERSLPRSQNENPPNPSIDSAPSGGPGEAPAGEGLGGAATTGATATGSSAQAETDVEMLAGRIYDRIRNRLRRELLDDRERAGLTLDRVR
jgi:hypothetical protein